MNALNIIGFEQPVFKQVEELSPVPPDPIDIKTLASEFLKANEESREAMRQALPSVIAMIERHIAQQVAEANNN